MITKGSSLGDILRLFCETNIGVFGFNNLLFYFSYSFRSFELIFKYRLFFLSFFEVDFLVFTLDDVFVNFL